MCVILGMKAWIKYLDGNLVFVAWNSKRGVIR